MTKAFEFFEESFKNEFEINKYNFLARIHLIVSSKDSSAIGFKEMQELRKTVTKLFLGNYLFNTGVMDYVSSISVLDIFIDFTIKRGERRAWVLNEIDDFLYLLNEIIETINLKAYIGKFEVK